MITASNNAFSIQLIAKDESGSTRSIELAADQGVFVGKSSNCGLQLPGEGIDDIHCRVGIEEGTLTVQDWMSNTGTRVNGHVIDSRTNLQAGDAIQIGNQQITVGERKENVPVPGSDEQDAQQETDLRQDEPADDATACDRQGLDDPTTETSFEGGLLGPESMDFDVGFDQWEEEATFDRETVDLLRAEIEELQSALAQRDSEQVHAHESFTSDPAESQIDHAAVDRRIEELSEEANRAEERASMLEEMLHAAEDSSRNEQEERAQLEGWVSDIETRISQREEEHVAEIEALKQRLDEAQHEQDQLRRRLGQAAHGGDAPQQYEETLEKLQHSNRQLQEKLAETEKDRLSLQQRLDDASSQHDRAMREERANIAKEQARISRLRFELSRKVADVESIPKDDRGQDDEASQKIKALRQHLREIHEQEKQEAPETTLTTRLAKLWKRVEY